MAEFGESFYGEEFYSGAGYRIGTELTYTVTARIIKPIVESPAVIDTWVRGFARYFDWLQQGIQAFELLNKIDYADGSDLDDVWGEIYDLPRLTSESDDDYRARLQTYAAILTGSGTPSNVVPLLNFLIGRSAGAQVVTYWPAQVIVTGEDVDTLRAMADNLTLLNSVLPGMFAAGVDYTVSLPYLDIGMDAAIRGDTELDCFVNAAIRADCDLELGIDAFIALLGELPVYTKAAIQTDLDLNPVVRAAIRGEVELPLYQLAAIQGDAELPVYAKAAIETTSSLPVYAKAAIKTDLELTCNQYAAIAKTFDLWVHALALVVGVAELPVYTKAAIMTRNRELTIGIRARITT